MLWDCFPEKKIPGGAPMNVALHAHRLGIDTAFISRVGKDADGTALLDFTNQKSLDGRLIQQDPTLPTGKVLVDARDRENIQYDIVHPVAWDNIQWSSSVQTRVDESQAFLFGSLAARNTSSHNTLLRLLETPALKILDINLRAPHFTADLLQSLLKKADILKINEDELVVLTKLENLSSDPETALQTLAKHYDLQMICLTLGAGGAMIWDGHEHYRHSGFRVVVKDTIGAGDAFLSGFVCQYLRKKNPREILEFACALGALVASREGGTPEYDIAEIDALVSSR